MQASGWSLAARAAAAAVAVAAVALSGCAEPPLHSADVVLGPGGDTGIAEVNLLMDANQTVSWEWEANSTALLFDVHRHGDGDAVQILMQSAGNSSHAGSFTAPAAGTYSLYWLNVGAQPIALSYTVRGDARLDPARPPIP